MSIEQSKLPEINESPQEICNNKMDSLQNCSDNHYDQLKMKAQFNDILKKLDPQYNLDLSYDSPTDKYFIISWNQSFRYPLDSTTLPIYTSNIVKLLNTTGTWTDGWNTLYMKWEKDSRIIYEDNTPTGWNVRDKAIYNGYIDTDNYIYTKEELINLNNIPEDMFRFVMTLKGIPEEDWEYIRVCETWTRCEIWLPDTWEYWEKIKSKLIRETIFFWDKKEID